MSSSVFRQITHGDGRSKADRLFRAAISAFCCLTRPSRREIDQLDDLALPLFDCISTETKRFACAALSECEDAPAGLVRRLCDQPVEICAPLLVRSRFLEDIDLIGLIGRHGLPHARAIARRPGLDKTIAELIRALLSKPAGAETKPAATPAPSSPAPDATIEAVRARLRAMMRPSEASRPTPHSPAPSDKTTASQSSAPSATYDILRSAALTGVPAVFYTAVFDALRIPASRISRVTGPGHFANLVILCRGIGLSGECAFLLAAALYPTRFNHAEAIKRFIDRFEATDSHLARRTLERWGLPDAAREAAAHRAVNANAQARRHTA